MLEPPGRSVYSRLPISRAVFFDLVGTLIRPRARIGEQYALFARRFGASDADPDRLGLAFSQAMRQAPELVFPGLSLEQTADSERGWWHQLVGAVVAGAALDDVLQGERFERFFAELYDHFTTAAAWEPYEDVVPALERLHARGASIGLITNYDTRVYRVLDAVGLAPFLDTVTIPALARAAKPDPAIFLHALQALQVDPRDAVHVGDEFEDDYVGAENAGMTAVLIDRHASSNGKGLRRIRSLGELEETGLISSHQIKINKSVNRPIKK
jgi:putative hydrolase of the HAD superfamily